MTRWSHGARWTRGALDRSDMRRCRTVNQIALQQTLILDVVCNFHGDAGVVQILRKPADINLFAIRAVSRVTLSIALAVCVALDVTRLSAISLLTPLSRRPRRSDDGTTNTVTGQILLNLSADALPREGSTVGDCSAVTAWWTLWSLWSLWSLRTRRAGETSEVRTLQVTLNVLKAVVATSRPDHSGGGDSRWPLRTRRASLPWDARRTRKTVLYSRGNP